MLPVSDLIRDEGYFDRAEVIYFVCVVVYFEFPKNSGVSWVRSKGVRVCFIWGSI